VWLLGLVSLFTDLASEAIYPLLPSFLSRTLGAGAFALGLIEGVAEAANSVLRIAAGYVSDRWRVRQPIVLAGYSLSSAVRPLITFVTAWPQVLALRFLDRLGKGIRGAPRDAMLAALAPPDQRGAVFGFNRAMDHAGAVAGPLLASLFLFFHPDAVRTLFALTLIPGAIVVAILFAVPEVKNGANGTAVPRASGAGWAIEAGKGRTRGGPGVQIRGLPRDLHRLLGVILLFTLGNSTDAFLLLRLGDVGVTPLGVSVAWAGLHVIKSAGSLAGGALSDRLGRKALIAAGWIVYAAIYTSFAVIEDSRGLVAVFLVYGLYYGLSESPEKALVADLTPSDLQGTAFGLYNAVLGFGSLLASLVFGAIWTQFGAPMAFGVGALLALVASVSLWCLVPEAPARGGQPHRV
jgi:MFS family permease